MMFKKILITLIFISPSIFSQKFEYVSSIGNFEDASSFYISPAGFVCVTDVETDEVIALDTLGNVIRKIGGYGWSPSAFDSPVDIYADALKIFVVDKNNHRIQRFDKNLNFIFAIFTRNNDNEEERFGYPLSAVMSNQGDVFILDSENSRIIKFDIFGNFIQNFGGYDYGNYALENPKQLAVSMLNNIYVIDKNKILIFDQYGNSLGKAEGNEEFAGIRILYNWLTVNTSEKIFISNLKLQELSLNEIILSGYEVPIVIISSLVFNDKLYVLTKKNILIFDRTH